MIHHTIHRYMCVYCCMQRQVSPIPKSGIVIYNVTQSVIVTVPTMPILSYEIAYVLKNSNQLELPLGHHRCIPHDLWSDHKKISCSTHPKTCNTPKQASQRRARSGFSSGRLSPISEVRTWINGSIHDIDPIGSCHNILSL